MVLSILFVTGMLSATASLGLILLWDVDGGLTQIDKFLYATDDYIKSGALLACGIVNARIRNDCDPAKALLAEHVLNKSGIIRTGAVIGYAVINILRKHLVNSLKTITLTHENCYES